MTSTIAQFNTLTFDCYGTLIDWDRGILAELEPWAAKHRLQIERSDLLEAFGVTEARCEAEMPRALYPQILEEVLRRLAAQWSVTLDAGRSESRRPAGFRSGQPRRARLTAPGKRLRATD